MKYLVPLCLFIVSFKIYEHEVRAQGVGCPCGIIKSSINSAHSKTQNSINNKIGQMEDSIVDALKNQTKQLSAGQEKLLTALEALQDAELEISRRMQNEKMARNAAYNRATTQSGCLTATAGSRLQNYEEVRNITIAQMDDKLSFWNGGEGRDNQSSDATAKSLDLKIQEQGEDIDSMGALVMLGDDLSDFDMENLTIKTEILTNPKPEQLPQLDGSSENAETYLQLRHKEQVRSLLQSYWSDRGSRYREGYAVPEWFTSATGQAAPDKISLTKFMITELERRFTNDDWHIEQQEMGSAELLLREANKMKAFDLFVRAQEFKQRERETALIAALLSLELSQ